MNEQAKTVVVFWNYLNSEGADGRNAKKRAQRALNREFICWPRGTAWLVYIPPVLPWNTWRPCLERLSVHRSM